MKTDKLFYRLFQDRPALVFELAGLPPEQAAGYVLRAEEIKQTAFRMDGLLVDEKVLEGTAAPRQQDRHACSCFGHGQTSRSAPSAFSTSRCAAKAIGPGNWSSA